jgi:non-canonical purine NTP pyrophosphatase (RdgB/HAM1 family)
MAPIPLKLCTSNPGKFDEIKRLLNRESPRELIRAPAIVPEVQHHDPTEVSMAKAWAAREQVGTDVLVDDSAFYLEALANFPGAFVAHLIKAGGTEAIHRLLPDGAETRARAVSVITLARDDVVVAFRGEVPGHVIATPRGTNSYGYDDVFVPEGETRTVSEMSADEKDKTSPKRQAIDQLLAWLTERGL